jgi:hypothetical protein
LSVEGLLSNAASISLTARDPRNPRPLFREIRVIRAIRVRSS